VTGCGVGALSEEEMAETSVAFEEGRGQLACLHRKGEMDTAYLLLLRLVHLIRLGRRALDSVCRRERE
jgi:hypothetical protein